MKMFAPVLAALAIAAPAAAAPEPDWATARQVVITMTNHGFIPRRVVLKGGVPTVIRFTNPSDRTHNFAAKEFFAGGIYGPRDGRMIADGNVNVEPGRSVTLHLITPDTRGARYSFRSTHLEDAGSDMDGNIFIR